MLKRLHGLTEIGIFIPVQEEEENMGDVDLWSLTEDGTNLTVNAKWLGHLQVGEACSAEEQHRAAAKLGYLPSKEATW